MGIIWSSELTQTCEGGRPSCHNDCKKQNMMQKCYLRLVLTPNIYTKFNNLPIKIHKIIEWKTFFLYPTTGQSWRSLDISYL